MLAKAALQDQSADLSKQHDGNCASQREQINIEQILRRHNLY